jgi:hypothetical protein
MAIDKTFLTKSVMLRLNTGLDEDFNPIYKTRSWRGVKAAASDANIFAIADGIGGLIEHTVDDIRVQTTESLEDNS